MASGVGIHDSVVKIYDKMKVRMAGTSGQDRLKLVMLRLSPDEQSIIVDETATLYVKDFKPDEDIFKKIMSMLPKQECRYALYDCAYETTESRKEDLVLIMWTPENAPVKSKMVYAASKNALKLKLSGMKHEWQLTDISDTTDVSGLVNKFGAKGVVKSVEGKPL